MQPLVKKRSSQVIMIFFLCILILTSATLAFDFSPAHAQDSGQIESYSLKQIYKKLESLGEYIKSKAPAARTGQTESSARGDDGDLQKGVPWPEPRFSDNGNGTVTDNLTGLVWLKDANPCGKKTWQQALTFCNNLSNGRAGLRDASSPGDWRLPNIRELNSLVDFSQFNPAMPPGHPFDNKQSSLYWSSTVDIGSAAGAWLVNFYRGYVGVYYQAGEYYVHPVRSGP